MAITTHVRTFVLIAGLLSAYSLAAHIISPRIQYAIEKVHAEHQKNGSLNLLSDELKELHESLKKGERSCEEKKLGRIIREVNSHGAFGKRFGEPIASPFYKK